MTRHVGILISRTDLEQRRARWRSDDGSQAERLVFATNDELRRRLAETQRELADHNAREERADNDAREAAEAAAAEGGRHGPREDGEDAHPRNDVELPDDHHRHVMSHHRRDVFPRATELPPDGDRCRVVRSAFGSELEAPNGHHHVIAVLARCWRGAAAERDAMPLEAPRTFGTRMSSSFDDVGWKTEFGQAGGVTPSHGAAAGSSRRLRSCAPPPPPPPVSPRTTHAAELRAFRAAENRRWHERSDAERQADVFRIRAGPPAAILVTSGRGGIHGNGGLETGMRSSCIALRFCRVP
jgi:hypothetical protein